MYFLVEFSVENVGSLAIDADVFDMQLRDSVENGYLLSPEGPSGERTMPTGRIEPGTSVQGTARYLVPETLAGPLLVWVFSPKPGSELRAKINIPYEPVEGEPILEARAEVAITDAFLSSDGDTLIIEGEIRNVGSHSLTADIDNISLTSLAGIGELRMGAPELPWTIEAGQTQIVELQYVKPDAPAALLSLLGYSFEIQGLQ
jgi:hypothetical protein